MELTLGDRYGFTALLGTRLETLCGCGIWISLTEDNKAFELSIYPLEWDVAEKQSLVHWTKLSVASMINLVEWSYIDRSKLHRFNAEFDREQCRGELKELVNKLASMDKERAQ